MEIIIIKECSSGNETVGSMWLETKKFPPTATLEEVLMWKEARYGKLIITVADNEENCWVFTIDD